MRIAIIATALTSLLLLAACSGEIVAGTAGLVTIAKADDEVAVTAFQPSGDLGGGVLDVGVFFRPPPDAKSELERERDAIHLELETSGLPPGAYTQWWCIINDTRVCDGECSGIELIPDNWVEGNQSCYWSTGFVVEEIDDDVEIEASAYVGEDRGTPGEQDLFGPGLTDPRRAAVFVIIKYHGPASNDPDLLYAQTTTLQGGCFEGANAWVDPFFGPQCFDPQIAIHQGLVRGKRH